LTLVVGHQSRVLLVAAGPHICKELGRLQKHTFVDNTVVKSKRGSFIARWKSGLGFGEEQCPKVRVIPLEIVNVTRGASRIRDEPLSLSSSERVGGTRVLILPAQLIRQALE
jgi:hypothetical protein